MFRDITTLLGDARAFRRAVDELVQPWAGGKIDKVAGIEARGFILGGAVAHQVSAGFVPIRKKGKLPFKRVSIGYSLEYGIDEMEMHEDAVAQGERVILVDDLVATGGTAEAAVKLLQQIGADVLAACFIIDLPDLGGAAKIERSACRCGPSSASRDIRRVPAGSEAVADHVDGPLYYERMGRTGPVMAFVHPNPMDQSCWMFQMAHMSTWYRCIAIDIPGYGRSPKARPGLTMEDLAQACWEAIDDAAPGETAILVGCSVGSASCPTCITSTAARTAALALSGTGIIRARNSQNAGSLPTRAQGIGYRWGYTFEDLSPAFRATPLAHFFADLFAERNPHADLSRSSTVRGATKPDADDHFSGSPARRSS